MHIYLSYYLHSLILFITYQIFLSVQKLTYNYAVILLEKGGVQSYPSSLSFNISESVNFFTKVNWVDVVVEGCAKKVMVLLTIPTCNSQSYFKTRQGKISHHFLSHIQLPFSEGKINDTKIFVLRIFILQTLSFHSKVVESS